MPTFHAVVGHAARCAWAGTLRQSLEESQDVSLGSRSAGSPIVNHTSAAFIYQSVRRLTRTSDGLLLLLLLPLR